MDGKAIRGTALSRIFALEKRLRHVRNTKLLKGVQERIQTLIDEKMMVPIGEWADNRDEFLKGQVSGHEKILFPWQTVLDAGKATEH